MRAVVQRVTRASVTVDGEVVGAIGPGLLVFVGVAKGDTVAEARWLAHKVANLRIFSDAEGKMNLSVKTTGGKVLVVSQFTLCADTRKGFRPSYGPAADPDVAEPLVEEFEAALRSERIPVESGIFGAYMGVDLVNDGPVTILLEKEPTED